MSTFRRRLMMQQEDKYAVTAKKNSEVMAICYAQGWAANPKHMTFEEAAAVTDLGTAFRFSTTVLHFEEFQYFTSVTNIAANSFFAKWTALTFPESLQTIKGNIFGQYITLPELIFPKNITYSTGYEYVIHGVGAKVIKVIWNSDTYPVAGFIGATDYYDSTNPLYYCENGNIWSADMTKIYLIGENGITWKGTETTVCDILYGKVFDSLVFPATITKFQRKYVTFNETEVKVLDMSACDVGADYPSARGGQFTVIKMPVHTSMPRTGMWNGTKVRYIIYNQSTPPVPVSSNATLSVDNNYLVAIYVPDAAVDTYKAANGFANYADKIKGISEYDPSVEN